MCYIYIYKHTLEKRGKEGGYVYSQIVFNDVKRKKRRRRNKQKFGNIST